MSDFITFHARFFLVMGSFAAFSGIVVCMTGRRFPRRAVFGEEYQLASAGASSLSQAAGSIHPLQLW